MRGDNLKAEEIIQKCLDIYEDMDLNYVTRWKEKKKGRRSVGYTPIYFPQEILYAMDILPVGLIGGGDMIDVVKGDSFYQSYICHIVRSVVDMELTGKLAPLDGIISHFVCDVMRNLPGVIKSISPDRYVALFEPPQEFTSRIGGEYYADQLKTIINHFNGGDIPKHRLVDSIMLYDDNRRLIKELYSIRKDRPWDIPLHEAYLLQRAGLIIDVEEHNEMLKDYMVSVKDLNRKPEDRVRVILVGSFCEQPPLALLKVIDQAGCYVVYDDFFLGGRCLTNRIDRKEAEKDPMGTIIESYLNFCVPLPCRVEGKEEREKWLLDIYKEQKAQGVVFAAPSFCDPALEERPLYENKLDESNIRHISFLYSEETGQFSSIKEQLGTFTDSIKIWGINK